MKRVQLFLICIIFNCVPIFALRTTLRTSIRTSSNAATNAAQCINPLPTTTRKVHFSNHVNTMPELETALTAAEYIFSKAMKDNNVNLVLVEADVIMGQSQDFPTSEELCKVDIVYTDTLDYNSNYPHIEDMVGQYFPTLYPMALSNQSRGKNHGKGMTITLNPNITLHCDTTEVPYDEYDAITLFLRALAMGSGIQSTFNKDSMSFGLTIGGQKYINAFDAKIHNDAGYWYESVLWGSTSVYNFLHNHATLASGYTDDIYLYNEAENGGTTFTNNTLNTIDIANYTTSEYNNGFIDLLEANFPPGVAIREITPYTLSLLKKLGWEYDFYTALDPTPQTALENSDLMCSGYVLGPNTYYNVYMSENSVMFDNLVCELTSMSDATYNIGTYNSFIRQFSYSSIPSNIQWKRNPVSKNIIGQLKTSAYVYVNGNPHYQDKICDIEIPCVPNMPIVSYSENTTGDTIHLHFTAFANGSSTYTVTYTGLTNADVHTFYVNSSAIDTIIHVPGTQLYDMAIYGTNYMGSGNTYTYTFGSSAIPPLILATSVIGNTLTYDLSNHGYIDITDVVISSVNIKDVMGNNLISSNAGNGEAIDISSLTRGYYILCVVADGRLYTKQFYKRTM